ncbi:MAG: hypothetical protein ABI904_13525 [Chloroflexota bacterium]
MKSKLLHWLAIILILEVGLLHIMTAQFEYEEAAYMGYLFAANFFGSLAAAFGIYHKQVWGWVLGAVIAAGSIAGYAWSRTLGMPGMNVEEWITPYGVISMSVEIAFLLFFLLQPWKNSTNELSLSINAKYLMPIAGLLVAFGAVMTSRWDVAVTQALGHHVGSLAQVCSTPPTTIAELEDKYGIQISLVATSMMNSIVDVRIKIIDPDKAHALLQNQAALLVGQQVLILAPHMHSHNSTRLKAGKIFTVFFPTQRIITAGTQVSLVFGSVRLEPVVVR